MTYLALTILTLLLALVLVSLAWRGASRVWVLPCPTSLAWLLENPLSDVVSGTRRTIERMHVQPGETVVEVGPGPGRLLVPVAQLVGPTGQAVGIELQQGMLDRLAKKLAAGQLAGVRLIHGDATQAHLPADYADLVFLCTVLGEIPDRPAAIQRCAEMLKPGSRLSITELVLDPHFQSQTSVRHLVEAAGLVHVETLGSRLSYTMNFRKPAAGQ